MVLGSYCEALWDVAEEKEANDDVEDFDDDVECSSRCKRLSMSVSMDESD